MLTQVDTTNASGDTLRLLMLDASNGYVVRDIQGLDPVNASLTSSVMAQRDGAQAQNARRETRNITMKLGLEPDYVLSTVDSLRLGLYDWFMPKLNIDMAFYKDDTKVALISGQVENCENNMFSDTPEVDISIICYLPDFTAPAPVVTSLATVSTTDTHTFSYPGTTDAGAIVQIAIDRDLTDFTIYNTRPDNVLQTFAVSGVFHSGDVVTINSIPGNKGAVLTRSAIDSSIMFWVGTSPNWIAFQKGDNDFRVLASGAAVPYTVTYTPLYGGL